MMLVSSRSPSYPKLYQTAPKNATKSPGILRVNNVPALTKHDTPKFVGGANLLPRVQSPTTIRFGKKVHEMSTLQTAKLYKEENTSFYTTPHFKSMNFLLAGLKSLYENRRALVAKLRGTALEESGRLRTLADGILMKMMEELLKDLHRQGVKITMTCGLGEVDLQKDFPPLFLLFVFDSEGELRNLLQSLKWNEMEQGIQCPREYASGTTGLLKCRLSPERKLKKVLGPLIGLGINVEESVTIALPEEKIDIRCRFGKIDGVKPFYCLLTAQEHTTYPFFCQVLEEIGRTRTYIGSPE